METIYEIVRIKQEVRDMNEELSRQAKRPEDIAEMAKHLIGDDDREVFLVFCLNAALNVIAVHRAHVGSLDMTVVSSREIFKACILNNASSIIVAHNHPSTNLLPSDQDFDLTKKLLKAGRLLDIQLLDHIIVNSKGEHLSFREADYLRGDQVARRMTTTLSKMQKVFQDEN